jgi:adenylate cyclase
VLRFSEVMSDGFDRERVRDKIVLIGSAAESVPDLFHVCLLAGGASGARIPGVELHAHLVDQLLRFALGNTPPLRVAGESTEVGLIAVCSALGAALGLLRRSASLSLLGIAGGLLAILGAGFQAYRAGVWLPLAGPALGWLCGAGGVITWISGSERRQRALLMRLFARHQSPAIAEELWAQRRQFLEGGRLRPRRLVATILFMDMKGSTAISEHLDPEDLMEFINGFMSTMAQLVAEHGGYVDDYFGDGLKADFGVPIPRSSDAEIRGDAQNAVRCALAAADALTGINARHRSRGWPPVAMRLGIHTGEVVSGSLGSDEKLKFTVVGDVVVAAARLESLDGIEHDFESRPARILASEQTVERLGDEFETESLGAHALRGRSQPLWVHRILGPRK